jgi:hypothetical protein
MSRRNSVIFISLISGLLLGLNSCLDISCTDETTAYVRAGFYSYSSKSPAVPDSLTLYGTGMALKVYNKSKITPPALIPLRDTTENVKFIFKINGTADTVEFIYWNYPHLISKECGYSMFHTVDTIIHTRNIIDSIARMNPNITTQNVENIRIYY